MAGGISAVSSNGISTEAFAAKDLSTGSDRESVGRSLQSGEDVTQELSKVEFSLSQELNDNISGGQIDLRA